MNFSFPRPKFDCFDWSFLEWPSNKVTEDSTTHDWSTQSSFPEEKALINGKSLHYKKSFLKKFFSTVHLTEISRFWVKCLPLPVTNRSGQWEWHNTTLRLWKQFTRRQLWCNENVEYVLIVLTVWHIQISAFRDPHFTVLISVFLDDHL